MSGKKENKREVPISDSTNKKRRVQAEDVMWCLENAETLSVRSFQQATRYINRQKCHSRYSAILKSSLLSEHRSRLEKEFTEWKKTAACDEFWFPLEQESLLNQADHDTSTAAGFLFRSKTHQIISNIKQNIKSSSSSSSSSSSASNSHHNNNSSLSHNFENNTKTTSSSVPSSSNNSNSSKSNNNIYTNNTNTNNNTNSDVNYSSSSSSSSSSSTTSSNWGIDSTNEKFVQYRREAQSIQKPCYLEPNVQEILGLADVLFLAPEQHSNLQINIFGKNLLHETMSHQLNALLDTKCSIYQPFSVHEFITILSITNNLDEKSIIPKQARLRLLNMSIELDDFKSKVIEGVADILMNLPEHPISNQAEYEEVDIQTRFYNPLLSALFSDSTKKVLLRWPDEKEESVAQIRPDSIISSLVQLTFGPSLGYGEVKSRDDTTTNYSLCVDTVKLALLSKDSCQKNGSPVISFQVNGFNLIFYMVQKLGSVHTMMEIGRLVVPNSLESLHSFVTLKNLNHLLRITMMFWNNCVSDSSFDTYAPAPTQDVFPIFSIISKSGSKYRNCPMRYI